MAFAYLLDPQKQYMTKSGAINTAGILRVFDAATDDPAVTYKDFNGTENSEAIILDNNGRAIVIAESEKAYRVEVYDRYNSLMWTTTPLWCMAAGGGVDINMVDVISSDGSVFVDKTVVGSTTTFDLSVADDNTELLEWLKAEGYTSPSAGQFVPTYSSGTMQVGEYGVLLQADQYYHFTSHFRAEVYFPEDPIYDSVDIVFRTEDSTIYSKKVTVDCTTALPQEFEVSFDVMAGTDMEVGIFAENVDSDTISLGLLDMEVHRVYSGAPTIPDGIAQTDWVEENFQEKLTAGSNIVIEDNVISATAEPQLNADWDSNSGVTEILHKPDLSVYARSADLSTVATTGSYDDLLDRPTIPPEQVNADWEAGSGKAEILHKPDLSVYATKTELADKQDVLTAGSNIVIENNVISATAAPQLNADWDANSGVQEILHKPDLSVYQEKLTAGDNIVIDGNTISATADPQVNADWDATSGVAQILNKPNMNDYQHALTTQRPIDINGENVIGMYYGDGLKLDYRSSDHQLALVVEKDYIYPSFDSENEGQGLMVGHSGELYWGPTQQRVDWDATSGITSIANKPDLSIYAQSADLATVATSGSYDDLTNKPTIPPGQVNSDWEATSGVAEILNKPSEKPLVAGANISITEGADSVTISATAATQQNADWDATSGVAEVLHKPDLSIYAQIADLATVATSGSYTDLLDKPSIPSAQVNSDWDATSGVQEILHKPDLSIYAQSADLATVATTGSYDDLLDKPSIPSAQVNSDWDATSGVQEILHKPDLSIYAQSANLATVATTGSYNSLTDTPTIPAAQVNSDWDATSGVSQILNKPEETTLTAGENITITESGSTLTISSMSAPQVNADWDATSGVSQILNKPDLSVYAQSADLAAVATTGSYNSLTDTPVIPAAQVNSDWDATSGVSEILNKPDLVDIVAGPGIIVDNPDGNTLRVSMAADYEEALYTAATDAGTTLSVNGYITLSESLTHFEKVKIYFALQPSWGGKLSSEIYKVSGDQRIVLEQLWYREQSGYNNYWQTITFSKYDDANLKITLIDGSQRPLLNTAWGATGLTLTIYKVVGINRISGGN